MSPKSKLSLPKIIDTAIDIANQKGFENTTLAAVALRLDVKPPSLFNYVDNLNNMKDHMRLRGVQLLKEHVEKETQGKTGEGVLRGMAIGYRNFARAYPGLYSETLKLDTVRLPLIRPTWESFIEITASIMEGYGLSGHEPLHAMRTLGSMMHGFVDLEKEVGFARPTNPDESYTRMLDIFINGLYSYYGISED